MLNRSCQIENEYGNIESSYGESGKKYVKWAAEMAVGLDAGVPWVMCQQADAPDPVVKSYNPDFFGLFIIINAYKIYSSMIFNDIHIQILLYFLFIALRKFSRLIPAMDFTVMDLGQTPRKNRYSGRKIGMDGN